MFSLLYGAWQACTAREAVGVLVLGAASAGKTTFMEEVKASYGPGAGKTKDPAAEQRARAKRCARVRTTHGMNLTRVVVGGADATFRDVAGTMREIWEQYFEVADALMFVLDVAAASRDEASLLAQADALNSILLHPTIAGASMPTPVAVIAHKVDTFSSHPITPGASTPSVAEAAAEAVAWTRAHFLPLTLLTPVDTDARSAGHAAPAAPPSSAAAAASHTGEAAPLMRADGHGRRREFAVFGACVCDAACVGVREAVSWTVASAKDAARSREAAE